MVNVRLIGESITLNASGTDQGAQVIGFKNSDTGGVASTVHDKLMQFVTPEDFGAVGDGTTNDRAAVNAAIASLGSRGGVVYFESKKYNLAGGDIIATAGVTLRGSTPQSGWRGESPKDFTLNGTVLLIDGTAGYSIRLQQFNSCLQDCIVIRSGLDMAPADTAALQAQVDAFAGTGVKIEANDGGVQSVTIIGFNQAIEHTGTLAAGWVRPRISDIVFDCTNGIKIGLSGDLGNIFYCHGFPIYSAFRAGITTIATNTRHGTAFEAPDTYDWGVFYECHYYGWDVGFDIADCQNILLIGCGCDNYQENTSAIGFRLNGTCLDARLIGCKSTAAIGYQFNFTGFANLTACSAWGTGIAVDIISGNVKSVQGDWRYLSAISAIRSWVVGAGAGIVESCHDIFDNGGSTYPGSEPFDVDAAALANFTLVGPTLISCTTSQTDQQASKWTTWIPTYTAGSGTLTTVTTNLARYQTVGKTVHFSVVATVTNNGSGGLHLDVSLPKSVLSAAVANGRNLQTGAMLQGQVIASGLHVCRVLEYDNSYPVATGNQIIVSGTYEAA